MIAVNSKTFSVNDEHFSHEHACRLSQAVLSEPSATVVIDLTHASHATTAAFATLVLLRRMLLETGRDLRLTGLHDAIGGLYEITRLAGVLPCV